MFAHGDNVLIIGHVYFLVFSAWNVQSEQRMITELCYWADQRFGLAGKHTKLPRWLTDSLSQASPTGGKPVVSSNPDQNPSVWKEIEIMEGEDDCWSD